MMKKIFNSFNLLTALVAALVSMSVTSCDRNGTEEAEHGSITVALKGAETRAGKLFTGDEEIVRLRVIVCAGNRVEKSQLFSSGSSDFVNPFVLEVITGLKTVYVVANETTTLRAQLSTVINKADLEALLADRIDGALALPLVMSGKTGDNAVNVVSGATNDAHVALHRAAAKIKLQFKKNTAATVKITKVSLLSNTGKTALFEGLAAVTGQEYWDFGYPVPGGIDLTAALQPIPGADSVYVYENLAGASDKAHAVRLEVEALYNNIPTVYRVYVNENVTAPAVPGDPNSSVTTPGDHLYTLKRNHEYRLEGCIENIGEFDGLTLTTKVLPWSRLSSQVNLKLDYSISPQPTPGSQGYQVTDASSSVAFDFQLNEPLHSSWTAHLTNPLGFKFDGASSGTAGTPVTITVRPKQGQGPATRTTEFYITVDGVEVPLINGNASIGPGNRVTITQPANP